LQYRADLESTRTNGIIVPGVKEPNQVFVAWSVPPGSPEVDLDLHICMTGPSFHGTQKDTVFDGTALLACTCSLV
jgi:hypothetical protein